MTPQPSLQFGHSLMAALEYWRGVTADLDDRAILALDGERQNLYRAVALGLQWPQAWQGAAETALQCFDLVQRRGYWREWLPLLEQALAWCSDEQPRLKFELLSQLGQLRQEDQQVAAALAAHHQAEALARQWGDELALAQASRNLSVDYWRSRQHDRAETYGQAALDRFTALGVSGRRMAVTLDILGLVAHGRGDYPLAEARLDQSVNLWRRLDQPTELAHALMNQAITLQAQRKFEAALACYQEAAAVLEPTASELAKVGVQNFLGTLYFALGRLAEAEAAFRRANSAALQQSANLHLRAQAGQNLGNVLLEQGRLEEAEAYLSEAITTWRQTEDEVDLANSLGNLAETRLKQGQPQAAVPLYDEAIALLARYPDDAWAVQLLGEFRAQRQRLKEA